MNFNNDEESQQRTSIRPIENLQLQRRRTDITDLQEDLQLMVKAYRKCISIVIIILVTVVLLREVFHIDLIDILINGFGSS